MTAAKTAPKKDLDIIVLPNVRLAFPNLAQARVFGEDQKAKFTATLLLDTANQAHASYKRLKRAINQAAMDKWGEANMPRKLRLPLLTTDDLENIPDGFEDEHVIIRANTTIQPGLVDRRNQDVLNAEQVFYPGCRVNAAVHAYAWSNTKGGKGVSVSLDHLQFNADDKPFGKRTKPADVFDALDEDDPDGFDDDEDDDDDLPL